jgi:membrane carboxypeptidase/penicillin-binding protein
MTGGGGALPYFNAFMGQFMKDKKRDTFPKAPGIPSKIKSLVAQRRREQLEKLERADLAGIKLEAKTKTNSNTEVNADATLNSNTSLALPDATKRTPAGTTTKPNKNPTGKPAATPAPKRTPVKTPAPKKTPKKPAGTKRKGKKGNN